MSASLAYLCLHSARSPQRCQYMASTTERLAVLKSVSIFSATSDDLLTAVANLLTECTVQVGEKIIERGEIGDCMYIIVEGRVRVHDGDRTLNYLEKPAVFGEMSVLDPAPRERLEPWRKQTSKSFALRMLPGDHFFLNGSERSICRWLALDRHGLAPITAG